MGDNPPPDWIPTGSRRRNGHLSRERGKAIYYYCDNCGNRAGGPRRKGIRIWASTRIFCSKACEDEYFPKWQIWLLSAVVYGALIYTFWPAIEDLCAWISTL